METTPASSSSSGGRRYACPEDGCDKVFSSSSHMRRHVRNHRDDRAFSCTHCGQAFIRREVWKRHESLHLNPQSTRPRIKPVHQADTSSPQNHLANHVGPANNRVPIGALKVDKPPSLPHPPSQQHPPPPHAAAPPQQQHLPHHHHHHHRPQSISHPPHSPHQPLKPGNPEAFHQPPPHHGAPLYFPFPSPSHSQPHPPAQLIQPWPVAEAGLSPADATNSIFPQLGIENWLDQILSDQATLPVMAAPATPHQPVARTVSDQTAAGPSSQEAQACRRLRDWFSEHGGKQYATALDPKRFARCLGSYWINMDVQYPIIHRPTFSPVESPPLLLLAIVLLGATATNAEDDWTWAEAVFPIARGLAFGPRGSDTRDRLHNLQSLVLLSIVGHSMGQEAQDHAHALLSAALTLARRANLYEDKPRPAKAPAEDLETQWLRWVLDESTRRVAWLILMRDIEYASFFHQLPSRATSPFRLPVDLPSPETCWDAPTAQAWRRPSTPGETLAVALKKAIHPGPGGNPPCAPDTEFAQLVLIYGLCALGWDVHKRDLITPEIVTSGPTALNAFLLRSFTAYALERQPPPRSKKQECLQKSIQNVALLAALECHVNMMFLQVFVGVTEIGTLQPVRPTDWIESCKVMRKWVESEESTAAVALSAQFLARAIKADEEPLFNGAWAIYSAFLVCWSYYVLARAQGPPHPTTTNATGTKDEALHCIQVLLAWVCDGEEEPDALFMRALGTQVVLLLSRRPEVIIKAACSLVDRYAIR